MLSFFSHAYLLSFIKCLFTYMPIILKLDCLSSYCWVLRVLCKFCWAGFFTGALASIIFQPVTRFLIRCPSYTVFKFNGLQFINYFFQVCPLGVIPKTPSPYISFYIWKGIVFTKWEKCESGAALYNLWWVSGHKCLLISSASVHHLPETLISIW